MMETIKKRHRSRRGETLVEILVAILIIALSAALFATMYSASMNIDLAAQKQDKQFYEALKQLEEMIENAEGGTDVDVRYKSIPKEDGATGDESTVKVKFFTQDGMSAYGEKPSAEPKLEPGGDTP